MADENMSVSRTESNRRISAEQLRAAAHYDPATGQFTRLRAWQNTRKPGSPLNTTNLNGYVFFSIDGRKDYAHRWAWLYMTGALPPPGVHIDHINGEPGDNRFSNLRLATARQNCANGKRKSFNTSGYKGVSIHKGRWRAVITVNRKQISLGSYDTREEAAAAYADGARRIHGEFARTE